MQAGFVLNGMPVSQAYTAALAVLQSMVEQQAAVMAYGDTFQIAALLASGGIIASLLIGKSAKPVSKEAALGDSESVSSVSSS